MYREYITTQEEALCHLFFHCCLKDEVFSEAELDQISAKIVMLGLRSELNIREEVIHYTTYKPQITNESEYLEYLVNLIKPVNDLALFSYCLELMLSDSSFELSEEVLADKIGVALAIEPSDCKLLKRLMTQRKVVEEEKIF